MKITRKRAIYVVAFFVLATVLYLIICVIPSVTGALTGTEVAEYGELRVSDEVTCYIVRDETVYTAVQDETLKYYIKDGTQIRKGTELLEAEEKSGLEKSEKYTDIAKAVKKVSAEDSEKHVSRQKGIFSLYADGYEAKLSPENMTSLKQEDLEDIKEEQVSLKRDSVAKGDPIYKIIDNSEWYLVFWIDEDSAKKYEEGNQVTAKLGDEEITCQIYKKQKAEDGYMVILSTDRYYSKFTEERSVEGEIVTTDIKGILVSNKCITEKDGEKGVYVKDTKGDYSFVPVQILGSDDEQSAVTEGVYYTDEGEQVETINNYDEVKTNP